MELVAITPLGLAAGTPPALPEIARQSVAAAVGYYERAGYREPWISYLAREQGEYLGTCTFRGPPDHDGVEIGYFTFPGNEGRGVATRMAYGLVAIARQALPGVVVTAQTLPKAGASARVLTRLGFEQAGAATHAQEGPVVLWRLRDEPRPP
jgi:RimJ/RimL family protein N-acetyltransferase